MARSASPLSKWKTPLTETEVNELRDFLASDRTSDEALMIDAVDGYMTAIALGPGSHRSQSWLPGVWGPSDADTPAFESTEQARRIIELLLRHYNMILDQLENDPAAFAPRLAVYVLPAENRRYINGEEWAMGFMLGLERCRHNWQPLLDDAQACAWLRPLVLLGADDLTPCEMALIDTPAEREALTMQIQPSVVAIRHYWQPYREALIERQLAQTLQDTAKITRNGRCFCGSGRAFGQCCGAAANLH